MHDGTRDLMRPDLWAGSLERSLERRRRSRRGSIELGRLRGPRELSNPEVLLDSLEHSLARREAVERTTGLPAPAARGLSIVGLLAVVAAPATGVMTTVAAAAGPSSGHGDTPTPTPPAATPSTGQTPAGTAWLRSSDPDRARPPGRRKVRPADGSRGQGLPEGPSPPGRRRRRTGHAPGARPGPRTQPPARRSRATHPQGQDGGHRAVGRGPPVIANPAGGASAGALRTDVTRRADRHRPMFSRPPSRWPPATGRQAASR